LFIGKGFVSISRTLTKTIGKFKSMSAYNRHDYVSRR